MATTDAIFALSDIAPTTASLATVTSSAEISLGGGSLWAFVGSQDMHIRYGTAGMAASSASYFRIPANVLFTLEMNRNVTHVRVFNSSGSTGTYHLVPLLRN